MCLRASPVPIRLVVVTAMQSELRTWVSRFPLSEELPFPQGAEADMAPLYLNCDRGVLGVSTGQGPFRAATSLVALGHDARFDLTHAYWLAMGIAGIDPEFGSIGSVVFPRYLVGLGRGDYLDGFGHVPPGRKTPDYGPPYPDPATSMAGGRLHVLDQAVVEHAFSLYGAHGSALNDSVGLREARSRYTEEAARRPPSVSLGGASVTGETFWAGRQSTAWARNASRFFTSGAAALAMSDMEDLAWYEAIASLSREQPVPLANLSRLIYIRSASDYCYEPAGEPLPEWFFYPITLPYTTFFDDPLHFCAAEAFEALWVAGAPVARALAPVTAWSGVGRTAYACSAVASLPSCHDPRGLWLSWSALSLLGCVQVGSLAVVLWLCIQPGQRARAPTAPVMMTRAAPAWVELDETKGSGSRTIA